MSRLAAAFLMTVAIGTGAALGAPQKPTPPKPPAAAPAPGTPTVTPKEKEPDQLVVGVAGPMSGQFGFIGEQMKRGAQQAVEDINAKGGVLGKKLKLVVADDGCDTQKASAVAA